MTSKEFSMMILLIWAKSIGLLVDFARNICYLGEIYRFLVRFRPKCLGYFKGLLLLCDGKQNEYPLWRLSLEGNRR